MKSKVQIIAILTASVLVLSGCASAVYNYDYERGNGMRYPSNVSVGFSPSPVPLSTISNLRVGVGADIAYFVIPMGSNIFLYNKDFYASLRIGDQWSTIDNEVVGVGLSLGKNFFLGKNSVISIGGSYTTLNLTPANIVEGDIKEGRLLFQKILVEGNSKDVLIPNIMSLFVSNGFYSYNFTGTVERYGDTTNATSIINLEYRGYLWSVGMGMRMQFASISYFVEVGKIFPRYMYDANNANPIRYDAYLLSGIYLNF